MGGVISPFEVAVPEAQLEDLRARLRNTRWSDAETVDDWSQGVPRHFLQELCTYWADEYDWRATEARLNGIGQFRTEIDGLGIHFLHVRSPVEDALPIVITHGWPGSVMEFLDAIGPLSDPARYGGDPADAFHVVCPSMPGCGFSDRPTEPGWGIAKIADVWAQLMDRLGYDRFGAQGGDYGAVISAHLARDHGEHVVGIHLNDVIANPDPDTFDALTDVEQGIVLTLLEHARTENGYFEQQSTKPQTLGYGLTDSPVAQCAWIVEKFHRLADFDDDLYRVLSRDQVLDDVTLYWLTATGTSSARLYWEGKNDPPDAYAPLDLPVGCSIFAGEVDRASRRWAEKRFSDIRYWNEVPRGGHYPAFEQPEAYVNEVRGFFRTVREEQA